MKMVRLSALRTGHLYPRKYSWYSFLLEAESSPGPWCGQKDYVNENSNDTIRNRNHDLPTCSVVLQPTALLLQQYLEVSMKASVHVVSNLLFTKIPPLNVTCTTPSRASTIYCSQKSHHSMLPAPCHREHLHSLHIDALYFMPQK
jgi:hypothetical protein